MSQVRILQVDAFTYDIRVHVRLEGDRVILGGEAVTVLKGALV